MGALRRRRGTSGGDDGASADCGERDYQLRGRNAKSAHCARKSAARAVELTIVLAVAARADILETLELVFITMKTSRDLVTVDNLETAFTELSVSRNRSKRGGSAVPMVVGGRSARTRGGGTAVDRVATVRDPSRQRFRRQPRVRGARSTESIDLVRYAEKVGWAVAAGERFGPRASSAGPRNRSLRALAHFHRRIGWSGRALRSLNQVADSLWREVGGQLSPNRKRGRQDSQRTTYRGAPACWL